MPRDLLLKVKKGKIILIPFPKINKIIEEDIKEIKKMILKRRKK